MRHKERALLGARGEFCSKSACLEQQVAGRGLRRSHSAKELRTSVIFTEHSLICMLWKMHEKIASLPSAFSKSLSIQTTRVVEMRKTA